jgi:hypothetical protein
VRLAIIAAVFLCGHRCHAGDRGSPVTLCPEGIARSRHGRYALTYKRQSIEIVASTSAVRVIAEMSKEDDDMSDKQECTT